MKIFIRVRPEVVVNAPNYNVPHSAHPPYLFSGKRKVDVIRWNPEVMMKASARMYRQFGLMKRPYILSFENDKIYILNYWYTYDCLPRPPFLKKPGQPFENASGRCSHLLVYVMQHRGDNA